ncbi:hypothetical protein CC78DRAFT_582141 [Lojkania enalia]|uniref:Uncharacterized protein n=1 Tax=Lojkania enalia TaxID=147567 RepID=A0A9P4K7P8_9PLEO|nr:hypothetical protein CC78DRAFT_582141 [Didymosphaeria enalia]
MANINAMADAKGSELCEGQHKTLAPFTMKLDLSPNVTLPMKPTENQIEAGDLLGALEALNHPEDAIGLIFKNSHQKPKDHIVQLQVVVVGSIPNTFNYFLGMRVDAGFLKAPMNSVGMCHMYKRNVVSYHVDLYRDPWYRAGIFQHSHIHLFTRCVANINSYENGMHMKSSQITSKEQSRFQQPSNSSPVNPDRSDPNPSNPPPPNNPPPRPPIQPFK